MIGEDFTLEGADVPGELLGHGMIGPDFQDVFAWVAALGCAEGLTQESGALRGIKKEAGIFQGWVLGIFRVCPGRRMEFVASWLRVRISSGDVRTPCFARSREIRVNVSPVFTT